MNKIRIGIVEDEVIIADDIQLILQGLGYQTIPPCGCYEDAIKMLKTDHPDLVILDINLGKKKDGIEVAKYIRSSMNIPFIFLSANSDTATVARAKVTSPDAYLVKPFDKSDLYTSIEIALFNSNKVSIAATSPERPILKDSIFIRDGEFFVKIRFNEILYLSSEHVYVVVYTNNRKFLIRTSMQEFLESFDSRMFFRVHRSYAVNLEKIAKINSTSIDVGGIEIPISKNYRERLLSLFNIK